MLQSRLRKSHLTLSEGDINFMSAISRKLTIYIDSVVNVGAVVV